MSKTGVVASQGSKRINGKQQGACLLVVDIEDFHVHLGIAQLFLPEMGVYESKDRRITAVVSISNVSQHGAGESDLSQQLTQDTPLLVGVGAGVERMWPELRGPDATVL